MTSETIQKIVIDALEDIKAIDIVSIDVKKLTSITDYMVICSGNSARHVKSIAKKVVEKAKENGFRAIGTEGEQDSEWILVDLGDTVVHVMQPQVRDFYNLEKLWQTGTESA